MTNIIRIDKRDGEDGYFIYAADGYLCIAQGPDKRARSLIKLNANELEPFMADLDSAISDLAADHFKRAG